jgi:hypothetical protein
MFVPVSTNRDLEIEKYGSLQRKPCPIRTEISTFGVQMSDFTS